MDAILETPTRKPSRITGERLGRKAVLVKALVASGESQASTSRITGISREAVRAISHRDIVPQSQVEPIVRSLRNRSALLAHSALLSITQEKLDAAGALECTKVYDLAMKNAGLAPPSVTESYSFSVSKYVNSTGSTPSEKTPKTCQILNTTEGK